MQKNGKQKTILIKTNEDRLAHNISWKCIGLIISIKMDIPLSNGEWQIKQSKIICATY
jgi:hypothetical protein